MKSIYIYIYTCECVSCCWDGGSCVSCAEAAGFRCRWTGDEMIWPFHCWISLLQRSNRTLLWPRSAKLFQLPAQMLTWHVFSLHFHLLLSLFSNRKWVPGETPEPALDARRQDQPLPALSQTAEPTNQSELHEPVSQSPRGNVGFLPSWHN